MKRLIAALLGLALAGPSYAQTLVAGDSRTLFLGSEVHDATEIALIGQSSVTVRNALKAEVETNSYDACVIWAGINDCLIYSNCTGSITAQELKRAARDCRQNGVHPTRVLILTNTPVELGPDPHYVEMFAADSIPTPGPALFRVLDLYDVFGDDWCDYAKTNDGPGVCLHPTSEGLALIGAAINAELGAPSE